MPTILTLEMAGEWISDGLSEQRITEIATSQLPADEMDVHTVRKDFLSALDPNEKFVYEDVSEWKRLGCNEGRSGKVEYNNRSLKVCCSEA